MQYKFADIKTRRAQIGDMREIVDIETVDMEATNNLSGDHVDSIVTLAAAVWAAVQIPNRGTHRMLGINTDGEETPTHIFYCRFWKTTFIEARYISWKSNRYRVIRADELRYSAETNSQIRFLCTLKGDTSKEANTWAS